MKVEAFGRGASRFVRVSPMWATASIVALSLATGGFAGDDAPSDARHFAIRYLFINSDARRVAAVTAKGRLRLLERDGEREINVATSIDDVRQGAFIDGDASFVLSGYDLRGSMTTSVFRARDGADLCRVSEADRPPGSCFAEFSGQLTTASSTGKLICTEWGRGVAQVRRADTGALVKELRTDPPIDAVLAFQDDTDLIVTFDRNQVGRLRVSDGVVLWRTRLARSIAPSDESGSSSSSMTRFKRDWASDAEVIGSADRVACYVYSDRLDEDEPPWRAVVGLDWKTGKEAWRRELDTIDRVFVAQGRGLLGIVESKRISSFDAVTGEFIREVETEDLRIRAVASRVMTDVTVVAGLRGSIRTLSLAEPLAEGR
jgi:hypothetical protein